MKILRILSVATLCFSMVLLVACSKEEAATDGADDAGETSQPAEGGPEGDGAGPTLEGGGGGLDIGGDE